MAKVLIVGCGDVGGRLAQRFVAEGHDVWGLRRQPITLAGVQGLIADVTRPETLVFPADLDLVYILLAPGGGDEALYRAVYVEGTRHVLTALASQSRLNRVFWASSSSVYGQNDGEWVDEDSPATPARATSQCLVEAEALVQASAWPASCVRLAGLYGPGRERLLRWVREGRAVQSEPPAWSNRLHVEDAAGFLHHLGRLVLAGDAVSPLYVAVDDAPVPQHEVLDALALALNLPACPRLSAGGSANKRLRNARMKSTGYRLRYPSFREGYAAMLGVSALPEIDG